MLSGGNTCELFFNFVDLDALDSSSIHRVLMSCLERHGLPCEKLKGKILGLAFDSTSTMTGVHLGPPENLGHWILSYTSVDPVSYIIIRNGYRQ